MRWALFALLLASLSAPAVACPNGELCQPFRKYLDFTYVAYVRTSAGLPEGPTHAELVRFLTASTWTLVDPTYKHRFTSHTVRFVDPKQPLGTSILRGRRILITRVEQVEGQIIVDIAGSDYLLHACGPSATSACLSRKPPACADCIRIQPARD